MRVSKRLGDAVWKALEISAIHVASRWHPKRIKTRRHRQVEAAHRRCHFLLRRRARRALLALVVADLVGARHVGHAPEEPPEVVAHCRALATLVDVVDRCRASATLAADVVVDSTGLVPRVVVDHRHRWLASPPMSETVALLRSVHAAPLAVLAIAAKHRRRLPPRLRTRILRRRLRQSMVTTVRSRTSCRRRLASSSAIFTKDVNCAEGSRFSKRQRKITGRSKACRLSQGF